MPFFARQYAAYQRTQGERVNGRSTKHPERRISLMLDIQPASSGDYERASVISGGRRFVSMKKAFADLSAPRLKAAGEDGNPGSIVEAEGRRWLVLGLQVRDSLPGMPTNGVRYLLVSEAEHAPNEVMA